MSDEIILYSSPEGNKRVAVYYHGETVWLTQKQMAELYNVDRSVITKHLGNIFAEGELREESVSAIFAHTAEDGKTYQTKYYNLDAFLQFNEYDILHNAGGVSHEIAKELAEQEYAKFRVEQDRTFESDFDEEVKKLQRKAKKEK